MHTTSHVANTKQFVNVFLPGQRRKLWPSNEPTLSQHIVCLREGYTGAEIHSKQLWVNISKKTPGLHAKTSGRTRVWLKTDK